MDVVLVLFLFVVISAVVYVILSVKQVPQGREWTVERFSISSCRCSTASAPR
jgi:regulator of protease activity HflC (stomatin/prohibitin superfamily)